MSNDYSCCNDCGATSELSYRRTFMCYLCDDCYTDALLEEDREKEQDAIDACYSNGEQDF